MSYKTVIGGSLRGGFGGLEILYQPLLLQYQKPDHVFTVDHCNIPQ